MLRAVVVEVARVFQVADVLRQDRLAVLHAGRTCSSVRRRAPAGRRAASKPGGSGMAPGAKPRARRSTRGAPAITRTTESSTRVAIARSWVRTKSAKPPSRCARLVIVDDLRLVRQIAAGHDDGTVDVAQQQKMQRRGRQHEAERREARRDRVRQRARRSRAAARSAPRRCVAARAPRPHHARSSGGRRRDRAPSARTAWSRDACAARSRATAAAFVASQAS